MEILRNSPNIAKATSVLLAASIGTVSCSSSKEATIIETEITPMTAVYEWPLVRVESRPTSGFQLVETIDDSAYLCTVDFEGNPKCSMQYDQDYIGYKRYAIPIDSESSDTLQLEGREYTGTLDSPPVMQQPDNTPNTRYSVESVYQISVDYITDENGEVRTCSESFDATFLDETKIRKSLTGTVSYNDSWGNKSIQFKKDGNVALMIDCD